MISYNCGCLIQDVISAVREKSYAAIIVLAPELCADEKALILNAGADALINMEKVTKDYLVALIKRFFIRVEQVKFVESFISHVHQDWKLSREKWALISPKGKKVNLTATEFTLIDVLLNHSPNPVSREVLAESLGRDGCENYAGHINTIISRLRKKVREHTDEDIEIKSYRAKGYSLYTRVSYLI
ncbi:MAG: winged helix-turn-helix domain-containing protein [Thiomicrospira sp.]